jgi:hypothetical protein
MQVTKERDRERGKGKKEKVKFHLEAAHLWLNIWFSRLKSF